jgi:hypothetical protein
MVEQVLQEWGGWYQWEAEVLGKRGRRVNTVQKMCIQYLNAKMIPVEAIPGIEEGQGTKENDRGFK